MQEKLENNAFTYAYAYIMVPYVDQTFEYYKYSEMDRREQGPEVVSKKEGKKAIMPTGGREGMPTGGRLASTEVQILTHICWYKSTYTDASAGTKAHILTQCAPAGG